MVEGILDRASAKPGPKLSKVLAREVWTHLKSEGAYQLAGEETYLFKVGGGVSTYYNFTVVGAKLMRLEVEEVDHRTEVNYDTIEKDGETILRPGGKEDSELRVMLGLEVPMPEPVGYWDTRLHCAVKPTDVRDMTGMIEPVAERFGMAED